MFWVPKRTVSLRRFFWVPTTYVLIEKKKKYFLVSTLNWSPDLMLINNISVIRDSLKDSYILNNPHSHHRGKRDIRSGHKIQASMPWPSTVTLTFSQHGWVMGPVHCLPGMNILSEINENPSRGNGDTGFIQASLSKIWGLFKDF